MYRFLGDYQQAIECQYESLEIAKKIGNRQGEKACLNNLGNVYESIGKFQKAIEYHQQSLAIAKEIGNLFGEGALCFIFGLIAFPFALIWILTLLLWRLLSAQLKR